MKKLRTAISKIFVIITISLVVFSTISANSNVYGESATQLQRDIVDYAKQWVGVTPYVWGGASLTEGADCSGFVMCIYKKFGISLPHGTGSLLNVGKGVSWEDIQLGDIIVTKSTGSSTGRHTGIYAGGGKWVNAQSSKTGTVINSVNQSKIIAIRRVVDGADGNNTTPEPDRETEKEEGGWTIEGFKPQGVVDDREINLDELEFDFAGHPAKMEYNGTTSLSPWLFSKFSQFADYIVSMMVRGVTGAVVGWTAIVEGLVSDVIDMAN